MDNVTAHIAFLYPGHAAEDDLTALARAVSPAAEVTVIHTDFDEDAHTVAALMEMGSPRRLTEGAAQLEQRRPDAVLWTSTSASFVRGIDGIREQVELLENLLHVPASTTAMAFARAITAINAHRVAIAASYPRELARRFSGFLEHFGVEVVHLGCADIATATEVGTLTSEDVLRFARENDHPDADAVLIPDTALHTAACLEDLEKTLAKPVLTANQVSFWEALRLCGLLKPRKGLGSLFRADPLG